MTNHFTGTPTAGSHDCTATNEDLHARIRQLEERVRHAEDKRSSAEPPPKKKKFKFKKAKKFFNTFVKPILIFIPSLLNAIAGCKKAFSPA